MESRGVLTLRRAGGKGREDRGEEKGGARSLGEAPLAAGPHPRPLRAAPEPPLQTRGAGCGKAAATASERITYPSLLRGTGRGGGARRVP